MPAPRPTPVPLVGAVLLALSLTLAGCSGDDPQPADGASASASATEEPDSSTESAPPADGPVGVFGDIQALPALFPADVPLVAGELRLADVMDGGGFTVLVDTGLALNATAVEGAVTLLTDDGWVVDTAATTPQLTILTKDTRTITLGVFEDDDQATLNYLVR